MRTTTRLRELLAADRMLLAPFTYDGFTARVAEEAGFDAVYMSGFGTSMSKGMPDVGLLTQTEMAQNAAYIASAVGVPVIADADAGYGNAINVRRTVREYERAGVAGLHVEDQVAPKKCGFFDGKEVIPLGEAAAKVRAAVEAREDADFVVIARTDALVVNGWDDVERRCRAFVDAGADLVFVDGIRTSRRPRGVRRAARRPARACTMARPTRRRWSGSVSRLQVHRGPVFSLYPIVKEMMVELRESGRISALDRFGSGGELRMSIANALGLGEITELERRYAASEEAAS